MFTKSKFIILFFNPTCMNFEGKLKELTCKFRKSMNGGLYLLLGQQWLDFGEMNDS